MPSAGGNPLNTVNSPRLLKAWIGGLIVFLGVDLLLRPPAIVNDSLETNTLKIAAPKTQEASVALRSYYLQRLSAHGSGGLETSYVWREDAQERGSVNVNTTVWNGINLFFWLAVVSIPGPTQPAPLTKSERFWQDQANIFLWYEDRGGIAWLKETTAGRTALGNQRLPIDLGLVTWLGESPSAPVASLPAELAPYFAPPLSAWQEHSLPSLESLARGPDRPAYSRNSACTSSTLCGYPKLEAPTVLASIGPSQPSVARLSLRQLGRTVFLLRDAPLRPWLHWGRAVVVGPFVVSSAALSLRVVRRLRHRWPLHRYFFFLQLASITVAAQPWPTLLSLLSALAGLSSPAASWLLLPTLLLPSPSSVASLFQAGRVAILCYNAYLSA